MLADAKAPQSSMTFDAAFTRWISQHPVKAGTKRSYRQIYGARLEDPLGSRKLADVARDPNGVEALAQCSMGRSLLVIVRGVTAWAQRAGMITDNRLGGHGQLRHGTVKRIREHVPFTAEDLEGIVAYLGALGIIVLVMFGTGCRVSEALALTADDFREVPGRPGKYRVHITRQRDHDTGQDIDLKVSGKAHTAPCSPELYRVVREHALRYGTGRGRLTATSYDSFAGKLRMATASVGLRMTAHNFRHDYALRMDRAGVKTADLAKFIGDTVETVMCTYLNHASEDAEALALAAL